MAVVMLRALGQRNIGYPVLSNQNQLLDYLRYARSSSENQHTRRVRSRAKKIDEVTRNCVPVFGHQNAAILSGPAQSRGSDIHCEHGRITYYAGI